MRRLGIWQRLLAAGALLFFCASAALAIDPRGFEDPTKQTRYQNLLEELRCLVCQNESLASSGAGLASDLRREVHRLVDEGHSEAEVKDFLLERYGDFVLYKPRMSPKTVLLWFSPLLIAIAGGIAAWITIRRRAPAPQSGNLTAEEKQRLDALLAHRDKSEGDRSS